MKTDIRTYNRAIDRGDYETARAIDAELDRQFAAKHPQTIDWSERAFEAQQRAKCYFSDGDESSLVHDPR